MKTSMVIRTNSDHPDFRALVVLLDQDLSIRDGKDHAFYAQFNKIEAIKEVVVAYKDDVAVGCGAIKPFSETEAEIKRMFVRPDNRGQGIASNILIELENWAQECHFTVCVLETGKKQPEAIALYQKIGYVIIPNYGQYIDVENSVCMRKVLPNLDA